MAETENICDLRIKQGMDDRENLEFKMNTENNLMVVTLGKTTLASARYS